MSRSWQQRRERCGLSRVRVAQLLAWPLARVIALEEGQLALTEDERALLCYVLGA